MYRLNDSQIASVVYGAIIQAADDYHEWKRYEQRGWRTLGRQETAKRKGSPARPMSSGEINHFTKWGKDAQAWFEGKNFGGLDFRQCCDALDYDPDWLARRLMQASFWRALKAKADTKDDVRKGFDEAVFEAEEEASDDQEAA